MLRTQVTVFESFTLGDYDAGITCPHHDREFHRLEPGSTQTFRYQMGEEPGFRMRLAV
jgi:hypothetical protein